MSSVGGAMRGISRQVAGDLANIGTSLVTASAIGIGAAATVGIRMAASLETATLQFQTLLGSADAAKVKVQQLFDFAKRTPFESGPVIEAARRLEIFGGAALDTQEMLTRVGNAAASVSAPIEEVAFWTGRAFNQIQAGKPFGEAAMRLQELGVVGGDTVNKMVDLAKAGGKPAAVFKLLTDHMDQFNGAMDRQQHTLAGLVSTVKDQISIGLATAFTPALKAIEQFLEAFTKFADSDAFQAVADDIGHLVSIVLNSFTPAIAGITGTFSQLTRAQIDVVFARIEKAFAGLISSAQRIMETLRPVAPMIIGIATAFLSVQASAIPLFGLLFPQISGLTGALLGLTIGVGANRDALKGFFDVLGAAGSDVLPAVGAALQVIGDTINNTFRGVLQNLAPGIADFARNVIPALADALAQVAPPLGDVLTNLAKIASGVMTSIAPTLAAIAKAVGAVLSAGLRAFASLLGVLADNIRVVGPLLAGLVITIAGLRFTNWLSGLKLVSGAVGAFKILVSDVGLQMELLGQNATAFDKIKAAAAGTSTAIGGMSGALSTAGITLGIAALVYSFQKAAEDAAKLKSVVQDTADTIREFGNTAQTASEFVADFLKSGARDADRVNIIKDMGISVEQLGAAVRGSKGEFAGFEKEVRNLAIQKGFDTGATDTLINSLERMRGKYQESGQAARDNANTQAAQKAQTDKNNQATQTYIDTLGQLRDALDEAAGKTLAQNDAQIRYLDGTDALVNKLREVNAASALVNGQFDLTTEAGRRGAEVVNTNITNFNNLKDAILNSGDSADTMRGKLENAYMTLVNTVSVGMGITTDAAMKLLGQLGLIPGNYNAQITADTKQADAQTKQIQAKLKDIDDTVAVSQIQAALDDHNFVLAKALLDQWEAAHATATLDFDAREAQDKIDQLAIRARQAGVTVRSSASGRSALEGVPMMPAMPQASPATFALGAPTATATMALAPRVYSPGLLGGGPTSAETPSTVVVDNKIFVGNQQITDIVRQEARVISRDRSMAFIGGVPG